MSIKTKEFVQRKQRAPKKLVCGCPFVGNWDAAQVMGIGIVADTWEKGAVALDDGAVVFPEKKLVGLRETHESIGPHVYYCTQCGKFVVVHALNGMTVEIEETREAMADLLLSYGHEAACAALRNIPDHILRRAPEEVTADAVDKPE